MRVKHLAALLLAGAPFIAAPLLVAEVVDHVAIAAATRLAALVTPGPTREPVPVVLHPDLEPPVKHEPAARQVTNRVARRVTKSEQSIRVGAARVLALAERGVIPAATSTAARRDRPAGLSLVNVSALGIGVQDGDVLTHVAGQPVQSVEQVIALVLAMRDEHVEHISARLYRGAVPLSLVVEQPYFGRVRVARLDTSRSVLQK
jgi:hypothetical protein